MSQSEVDQERELALLDEVLLGTPEDLGEDGARILALMHAVRDDRPPLRPAFADELEARLAAGFPRRRGRSARATGAQRGPGRLELRHWLGGLGSAVAVAVVVLVVVAGGMSRRHAVSPPPIVAKGAPPISAVAGAAPAGSADSAAQSVTSQPRSSFAVPPPSPPARKAPGVARVVQRDASLALLAPRGHVQQVADHVIAATDRLGGIVETSNVTLDDKGGSQASLELSVPSAQLDRALAALSALAHVSSRSQNAQDITDPTAGARDALAQARAERHALLRQLAGATDANQVAAIHAQLGLVTGRINQDQAQLQSLLGRGAAATLSVTITEDPQAGAAAGGSAFSPGAGLDDALTVLEAVFAVLLIALAVLVPAALLGGLCWLAYRPLRRQRREGALSDAG